MRDAQRDYFKTRSRSSLERSKHLEKQVDAEIERVKTKRPDVLPPAPPEPGNLFAQ